MQVMLKAKIRKPKAPKIKKKTVQQKTKTKTKRGTV